MFGEDLGQRHPGPFRGADRAALPLFALGGRVERGAAVAGAFQGCRQGLLRQL